MNSLGFDKPEYRTKVVVAMSGGVDSAVTAALLAEQGFDVVGITLQLYDHGIASGRKGACCAGQDIQDARNVADMIGIPHYVLDFESLFQQAVIEEFADDYARGRTPIPCVRCNQRVKFEDLLIRARELGADCLATGHYADRTFQDGAPLLRRAADPGKDQTHFLFATTRDQLDYLRFPLGQLTKTQTRALAARLALPIADKAESQDICFVASGHYSSLVAKLRPEATRSGPIRHVDGRLLGQHNGIIYFTVGQRRGLNVAVGEPLYVVELDPDQATVIVGPRDAGRSERVILKDTNWLPLRLPPPDGLPVTVKHRYNEPEITARVFVDDGVWSVAFDHPEDGVAPGQACVIYTEDLCLGGGWIDRTVRTPHAAERVPFDATQADRQAASELFSTPRLI